MSQEGVEVVRNAFGALAEGGVEAMLVFVAEDFEMTTPAGLAAEPDTYRGHAGARRWFDSFYEAVDELRIEPGRIEPVGEQVAVEFRMTARGRTTGIEASQNATGLCDVRAGAVTRLEFFGAWEEALEAAASA